jgi:hypothetical protein
MDGMDNNYYKSQKDSSKSVIINKLKCINNNLNINGNNAGNINIGNKGQGYLGVYSSDTEGYYDGHSKKDKDFDCTINNNNTNTNVVAGGSGNVTDGNVTDTCEECFLDALGPTNLILLERVLDNLPDTATNNLEELCIEVAIQIASGTSSGEITDFINSTLSLAEITLDTAELESLVACLFEVFGG